MAFAYNSLLAFQWLDSQNLTQKVLQMLFSFLGQFKKEFEFRRMIFGLSAIIKTAENALP